MPVPPFLLEIRYCMSAIVRYIDCQDLRPFRFDSYSAAITSWVPLPARPAVFSSPALLDKPAVAPVLSRLMSNHRFEKQPVLFKGNRTFIMASPVTLVHDSAPRDRPMVRSLTERQTAARGCSLRHPAQQEVHVGHPEPPRLNSIWRNPRREVEIFLVQNAGNREHIVCVQARRNGEGCPVPSV